MLRPTHQVMTFLIKINIKQNVEDNREMKIMTWMHTAKIMNAQTLLECGRRLTFFSFVLFFKIFRESATRSRR